MKIQNYTYDIIWKLNQTYIVYVWSSMSECECFFFLEFAFMKMSTTMKNQVDKAVLGPTKLTELPTIRQNSKISWMLKNPNRYYLNLTNDNDLGRVQCLLFLSHTFLQVFFPLSNLYLIKKGKKKSSTIPVHLPLQWLHSSSRLRRRTEETWTNFWGHCYKYNRCVLHFSMSN